MQKKSSIGLMGKLYDYWGTHVGDEEMAFYREAIQQCGGKALELACGGGRLILSYLQEGLDVEGVEASSEMCELLKRKAARAVLQPVIYQQQIDALQMEKTYHLIYIPLGSFQLITFGPNVTLALHKYHMLLEEGGKLIVTLFLPYAENLVTVTEQWRVVADVKGQTARLIQREQCWQDPVEELIVSKIRLEVWEGKEITEMVERDFSLRWYSKGEFELLLKNAGFRTVEVQRAYTKFGFLPSFMLFIATK